MPCKRAANVARRPVRRPASLACASAFSRITVIQALIFGFQVLMESRQASVRSTGENFLARMPSAACFSVSEQRSEGASAKANRAAMARELAMRNARRDGFSMSSFTAISPRMSNRGRPPSAAARPIDAPPIFQSGRRRGRYPGGVRQLCPERRNPRLVRRLSNEFASAGREQARGNRADRRDCLTDEPAGAGYRRIGQGREPGRGAAKSSFAAFFPLPFAAGRSVFGLGGREKRLPTGRRGQVLAGLANRHFPLPFVVLAQSLLLTQANVLSHEAHGRHGIPSDHRPQHLIVVAMDPGEQLRLCPLRRIAKIFSSIRVSAIAFRMNRLAAVRTSVV